MKLSERLKRTIALILVGSMFVSTTPVFAMDYTGHWAEKTIEEWKDKGIINGYEDGSFRPRENVTRAEFAKMLVRIFGLIVTEGAEEFADIEGHEWYAKDVSLVSAAGFMTGIEGHFRPKESVTREEAAYALATAYHMTGETEKKFKDQEDISAWAEDEVEALVARGYINGYPDGTLRPQGSLTRAEALTMLDNITAEIINIPGTYTQNIHGNLVVNKEDVVLKDTIIDGNLYLTEGIGEGDVTLENVKVTGTTVIEGGGVNSVKVKKSELGNVVINKAGRPVRLAGDEQSKLDKVVVASPVLLEGKLEQVEIATSKEVKVVNAVVTEMLVVAEKAKVVLDEEVVVEKLVANASSEVFIEGKLKEAVVNADDVIFHRKPEKIEVVPGVSDPIILEEPNTPSTPSQVVVPSTPSQVVVTSVEVVTPSKKTNYTVGEALDLAGLQIKLVNNNNSTEVVGLDDFARKGLTTSPMQGSILTIDCTTVEIIHSASGKKATQSIIVSEKPPIDKEAPVLQYDGPTTIEVAQGKDFTVPKVTATDNVDEIVEVNVVITNKAGEEVEKIDTTKLETYTITYSATDKAGNKAEPLTIEVKVIVIDKEAPVLQYDGPTTIEVAQGKDFTVPKVTATDNVDEIVEVNVVITDKDGKVVKEIDTKELGTYTITYTATDKAGNKAELKIKVSVVDKEAPVLQYDGPTTIEVEKGKDFTMPEVTATDNVDKDVEVKVVITDGAGKVVEKIDTTKLETYTITYSATDKAGNSAKPITITVEVKPVKINIEDIKVLNETKITFTSSVDATKLRVKWNGEEVEEVVGDANSSSVTYGVTCKVKDMKDTNTLEISAEDYAPYVKEEIKPEFKWEDSTDITWYNDTEKEFTISTASQLAGLAEIVNSGKSFNGKIIKLSNDIDLLALEWTPIGREGKVFSGQFDGAGHTISNLRIDKSNDDNIGLFGKASNLIENINLENVSISGGSYVGSLVGYATGSINGCTIKSSNIGAKGKFVGGVVGYAYAHLSDCKASDLTVTGTQDIGGIVGYLAEINYTAKECVVESINLKGLRQVGGIAGTANGNQSKIIRCRVEGVENIIRGEHLLGGIVGAIRKGITIEDCYVNKQGLTIDSSLKIKGWYAGGNMDNKNPFKLYQIQSGDITFIDNTGSDCTFAGNQIRSLMLNEGLHIEQNLENEMGETEEGMDVIIEDLVTDEEQEIIDNNIDEEIHNGEDVQGTENGESQTDEEMPVLRNF